MPRLNSRTTVFGRMMNIHLSNLWKARTLYKSVPDLIPKYILAFLSSICQALSSTFVRPVTRGRVRAAKNGM